VPKYGLLFVDPSLKFATCHAFVQKYVLPLPTSSLLTRTDKRYVFVLSIAISALFHQPSALLAASLLRDAHTVPDAHHGVFFSTISFSFVCPFSENQG